MKRGKPSQSRFWRYSVRLGLVAGGLLAGLIVVEVSLVALDQPRFYTRRTSPNQFWVTKELRFDGRPFYLNTKSDTIRFVYDSNPRGYFGPDNEIEHRTNSSGLRGPEFQKAKSPETLRLMFLGDSFTFGEGVRFEHTYPEVAAPLLRAKLPKGRRVEAYNFGVGGYNTTQSLDLLRMTLKPFSPDIVVLGYVPNDAEPPLYLYDPATNSISRRPRQKKVPEGRDDVPPDRLLFQLRTSQLVWQFRDNRRRSQATVAYYRSLYEEPSTGWLQSRLALQQISEICGSHDIPFCVLLFPILHELTDNYPLRDIHDKIAQEVNHCGAIFVDLFPKLKGMDAHDLWVHPTDQHPNEKVHAIAAKALVDALKAHGVLDRIKNGS